MACRDAEGADAPRGGALRDGIAKRVIGADNRRARMLEDRLLHGRVVFKAAVAVDMVRRDVEQDRGVRVEAWRQVELEAGELDHIIAAVRERRQVEHRLADIAAKHRVFANGGEDVMRERCCGGFAVRAGDGDHLGRCARRFALADENLGVADDLDAVLAGELHRPMRLGMGERHAGRQHQRIDGAPIRLVQIAKRQSSSPRRLAPALAVVPGQNLRPARQQRPRRRDPRHPHAKNGGGFSSKRAGFDHATSRS